MVNEMGKYQNIDDVLAEALANIAGAPNSAALEDVRIAFLGKNGRFTALTKMLATLPVEEKKAFGQEVNVAKAKIESELAACKEALSRRELDEQLRRETIDVTKPIRPEQQGRIHPVSKIYEEVVAIFGQMGFEVAEGPDIEDQFHNFNALNTPANHPARQMQDTFYVPNPESSDFDDSYVVRTQTSSVQINVRRYGLLHRDVPIVRIMMQRIRRCSIKLKDWLSTRILQWRTSKAVCMIS